MTGDDVRIHLFFIEMIILNKPPSLIVVDKCAEVGLVFTK